MWRYVVLDGDVLDGVVHSHCGVALDGDVHGGDQHGGDVHGGEVHGVEWRGEEIANIKIILQSFSVH